MDRPGDLVVPASLWAIGGTSLPEVEDFFAPLHAQIPNLIVTVYLPPAAVGPLDGRLPYWLHVGPLGWEGAPYECLAWTSAHATARAEAAREMGYNGPFMPPWGALDGEVLEGLAEAGMLVHVPPKPGQRPDGKLVKEIRVSFDGMVPGYPSHRTLTPELLMRFNLFVPSNVLASKPAKLLGEERHG